jgi:hypothetical protein
MDTKSSKTHESSASNISITRALAEEVSPGASFKAEELEEINSSRRFLFLSRLGSSEQAGEATKWTCFLHVKFWHHLCPGSHQPRGPQKQQRQDPPELVPPLEEEDGKPRIGGPMKEKGANY